jgi:hypothetical protein
MALKSAYDDLRQRTLGKIEGLWGKLCYFADRRSPEGGYEHWGFERVHGTAAAQETFARAHELVLGDILRARISLLQEDLEHCSQAEGINPASYVLKLTASQSRLLPSDCPQMTKLHLVSVLKTLSILETRQRSDSPDASQLPQLDR